MNIGICSFSFHRLLAAGKQDIFQYIKDCKELGCTQLDPWNAHLSVIRSGDAVIHAGHNPAESNHLTAADEGYITEIKAAADAVNMPFGCIAVDGAHIYEADEQKRRDNRARAYRWLDVAVKLQAKQIRVDAGGPPEMPADVFAIIVEGYRDLIARARPLGIEILVENHWGPTNIPDNVTKLLTAVPGLGLLFDTNNWKPELRETGWRQCAHLARYVHVKTFTFDDAGNDPTYNVAAAIQLVKASGYKGTWGIESVPKDGDEMTAARKTIAMIRRLAA